MRILLCGLSGQDLGETIHYHRVLQRLGHQARWISTPARGDSARFGVWAVEGFRLGTPLEEVMRLVGWEPNLLLYIEPEGFIPEGIERAHFPTACVISDCHRNVGARQRLARFFDHVFLYHRNHLRFFREHPPQNVHWHPYACDLTFFRRLPVERDLDVAFVGKLFNRNSERSQAVAEIAKRWKVNEQRYYLQEEIPCIYSRAKIVVNFPLADDLNFRFFEALSCGSLLVTRQAANGQEILFRAGEHYVGFENHRDLLEKIEYYLAHDDEREGIALAGHNEAVARHGLDRRLTELLERVEQDPHPAAPIRRMEVRQRDAMYAWLYSVWGSIDAVFSLLEECRRDGRAWAPLSRFVIGAAARRFYRLLHASWSKRTGANGGA